MREEAYSLSPEVIMPVGHASSSPECTKTQCLSRPEGTFSNFALDNRWLSVYTVCMDALSSPEMQSLMDTKISEISSSSLRQDEAEIGNDQSSFEHSSHIKQEKQDLFSDQLAGCNSNNGSRCEYSEQISGSTTEQLHTDEYESDSKANTESNLHNMHHEEDSELFKQHFGSLSNTQKMEARKSLLHRSSARFVVQHHGPGDCKRLYSTPIRNMTDKTSNYEEDATTHSMLENDQVKNSLELGLKNSTQISANSVCALARCTVKENLVDDDLSKDRDKKESLHKESKPEETIIACKDELNRLDSSAESALQLFSMLEINSCGDEILGGAGAQLYNEAAELLPSIIEKVNAVARLVRGRKNDLFDSTLHQL